MHESVRVSSRTAPPFLNLTPARLLVAAVLLTSAAASAQSVYYVAPTGSDATGNGSAFTPWATVSKAILAVPDDGSTVIVRDGVYNGTVYAPRKFKQLVTFRAEHPYQARLRNADDITLHIRYASNIEFAGFDVARSNPFTSGPVNIKIAGAENIILRNNIIHESYNNDLLKMNEGARNILITGNVFRNQQGGAGQHIDVNGCVDVSIRENIFFNDAAAAGISAAAIAQTHGFVVVKNSSMLPESRRTRIVGNIFMNFQGGAGSNYVLLGEDGYAAYETQEVDIANNLLFGNFTSRMKAPLGFKGVRMAAFRNNTVTGDMPSDAFAVRINKEGTNLRSRDIRLTGNIWSDPTGTMTDFADGSPAESSDLTLDNNVYWNNGQPIPSDADVLNAFQDVRGLTANPYLPSTDGMLLPNWQGTQFSSGTTSIRDEFVRLVQTYGRPAAGSPVIGKSDPADSPEFDILDSPRGPAPDAGAVQVTADAPAVRVLLFTPRVMGGVTTYLNRIAVPSSAGTAVFLTSSNPGLVSVPALITIPAGDDSVAFPIATTPTTSQQQVTITATSSAGTYTATLTVVPQGVVSVAASYAYPKPGTVTDHYIMLEGPAEIQPLSINLANDQPDLASFPGPVTFPAGKTYAGFNITCKPETTNWTRVNITASGNGSSAVGYVEFQPALTGLSSLSLSNTAPKGPTTVTGTLRLSGPAQSNISVTLSASPSGIVSMPSSLAIKTAYEGGTFSITVPKVIEATTVTITATLGTSTQTAVLNLGDGAPTPVLSGLSLSAGTVKEAGNVAATVTLSGPAPAGGAAVTLAANPAGTFAVPPSVSVPAGATSANFNVNVLSVSSAVTGTVSATWGAVTKTATLTVQAPEPVAKPTLSSFTLSSNSVEGSENVVASVTLSAPAPAGGVQVNLAALPATILGIPATISIPQGATSGTATISTKTVLIDTPVLVSASYEGIFKTALLAVLKRSSSSVALSSIVAPTATAGGYPIVITAILASPAPAGGLPLTLATSHADVIAPVTLVVPAGSTRASVSAAVNTVAADTSVTISAQSGSVTQQTSVMVKAPVISKVYIPSTSMGGNRLHVGIYLSAPAPAQGLPVSVVSSRPDLLTLPASVSVAPGTSKLEVYLPTATVAQTTSFNVVLTAGSSSVTHQVSLFPATPMNFYPGQTTVKGGSTVDNNVILFTASPAAGTPVTITSSNPFVVSVPAVFLTPAGVARPSFTFTTSQVYMPTPVTISITSGGVTKSATITVMP